MRKSVVSYILSNCQKCLKCLRNCPTDAIKIKDNRVVINDKLCINCGMCIKSCHNQGLKAKGSTLYDIKNYDYSICLVPSALINNCNSYEYAQRLFAAIKKLGFDEVIDISDVEAQVYKETSLLANSLENEVVIASFCPEINRLIKVKYPLLINNVAPINYPSEIMAKMLRDKYKDIENLGIFNLCECVSKLEIAKYPYGNSEYEVDHALAIVDVFPLIKENMSEDHVDICFCPEGLQCASSNSLIKGKYDLIADGFDKVSHVLEHAEFGALNEFKLISLFPCFNGCIGGNLLWGNSYLVGNNIHELCKEKQKSSTNIPFDLIYAENVIDDDEDMKSLEEKMAFYASVNDNLVKLPNYDCGACGLASCRMMAEEIALNEKTFKDCKILELAKEKQK